MLQDECRLPNGSDQAFLNKVLSRYGKHASIRVFTDKEMLKIEGAKGKLVVKHYAGEVWYDVNNFLKKSTDQIRMDVVIQKSTRASRG